MTLSEFLILLTRLTYGGLALIAVASFLRQRDRNRLDIALLFGMLGWVVMSQQVMSWAGVTTAWVVKLNQLLVITEPYLLIRLVDHFQPVPRAVRVPALVGMVALWALWLLGAGLSPLLLNLPLIAYFGYVNLYAAWAFVRGATQTRGVTRWRMGLAAGGAGLIALTITVTAVGAMVPAIRAVTPLLIQLLAVLSGLAFYAGFAPPRWLRYHWQLPELHQFLKRSAESTTTAGVTDRLSLLGSSGLRVTGGQAALIATKPINENVLVVRAATLPALEGMLSLEGALGQVLRSSQPVAIRDMKQATAEEIRLAKRVDAEALLVVPIVAGNDVWGVLAVLLRRWSLFPADDLAMLTLLAEQEGRAQEQGRLAENLKRQNEYLETANQELEAFAYSVSHDLRAPLRHIEGFTELLAQTDAVAEPGRPQLERILSATARMGNLIDVLLNFSRIGRAEMSRALVPLDHVVAEARRELQPEAEGRQVIWQIAPLPRVAGDPTLLRQVFVNLLSNALKYTRPRSPARIEIGTQAVPDGQVVVFVRDNGVGFNMQYVDRLFTVFKRLHHADEYEGTGIGLANVRRIIQRHGGRVWAESQGDGGATFYLSLPPVAAEPNQPVVALKPSAGWAQPAVERERVI